MGFRSILRWRSRATQELAPPTHATPAVGLNGSNQGPAIPATAFGATMAPDTYLEPPSPRSLCEDRWNRAVTDENNGSESPSSDSIPETPRSTPSQSPELPSYAEATTPQRISCPPIPSPPTQYKRDDDQNEYKPITPGSVEEAVVMEGVARWTLRSIKPDEVRPPPDMLSWVHQVAYRGTSWPGWQPDFLALGTLLLSRVLSGHQQAKLSAGNAIAYLATATMIAGKTVDDGGVGFALDWERILNVHASVLTRLEKELLGLLDWRVCIDPDEFRGFLTGLKTLTQPPPDYFANSANNPNKRVRRWGGM